jgi:methionyl-tRNA synthetase
LVADFGNFVNRVMVLTHKFYQGEVPVRGEMIGLDLDLEKTIQEAPAKVAALIDQFKFKEAQFEVLNLARAGNKYLADMQPWKLGEDDKEVLGTIMNLCLQTVANLAILIQPFLPNSAKKLSDMLGLKANLWAEAGSVDLLTPYFRLTKPELLFEKLEDKFVEEQVEKLERTKFMNLPAEELKESAQFDDFAKLDIRVATILTAEKVKKTKKLLKLQLDTGVDKRTVVSGIAEYYAPEDIIGQKVLLLANLAPKEIKGIESHGMILMAEDRDGSLSFVAPDKIVMNGSTVR